MTNYHKVLRVEKKMKDVVYSANIDSEMAFYSPGGMFRGHMHWLNQLLKECNHAPVY